MTGVDTNVLIYACDKGETSKQQRALEVISSVTDGVLLWQVACEFVAASRGYRVANRSSILSARFPASPAGPVPAALARRSTSR